MKAKIKLKEVSQSNIFMLTIFFNFCLEIEFYLKIAISCVIVQQGFYFLLNNVELNFITEVLLYWLVGSISFYL